MTADQQPAEPVLGETANSSPEPAKPVEAEVPTPSSEAVAESPPVEQATEIGVANPSADPSASESVPESSAAPGSRPSERIQIGSKRTGGDEAPKAKPIHPVATKPREEAEKPKSNYPPPNVREQLSPELEQELAVALGGESLEAIIEEASTAEATGEELPADSKVTGTVAKIHREDIFLELGGKNQGMLPLKQFEDTTPPEIGSQLEVIVARYNAAEGLYHVTLPTAAVSVGNWDEVEVGQVIDVAITGSNKGGLECQVSGIRGFIPMGQISIYRVENPEEYVGQKLTCVITEANRGKKNLVLSHRALMERERKEKREKLLAELAPGQIHEGVVRSLQDFGAFVDLGGVDGLIHVSQISWERIGHPRDVLQEGQTVKVRVEKVNQESGKISLTYRDLGENPWNKAATKYPVGSTVKGTVSKLMQFGAFVRLEAGVEGLIHISEMGHGRVNRASDVVSEGQTVEVKVLAVDVEAQRISLSLKALLPPPEKGSPQGEKDADIPAPEEVKRKRKPSDKNLKGGIGTPTGGEKFGLKW